MFQIVSLFVLLYLQLHFVNGQDLSVTFSPIQVTEGDSVDVTFTLSATPVGSDFNVAIIGNSGQFDVPDTQLTFPAGTTDLIQVISITLRNDDVLEVGSSIPDILNVTTEFNGQTSEMVLGRLLASDSTVLVAGFEEESYTFVEGDSGCVCVSINGTLVGITQTVRLTYVIGSAEEPNDYEEGITTFDFSEATTDNNQCFMVVIPDDDEIETREDFTIQLSSSMTDFVDPARSVVTISILDADADCGPYPAAQEATALLSGDYLTFNSGDTGETTVTNQGATATYTCSDQELILTGESELVCELIDGTRAEWSPSVAPTCEMRTTQSTMVERTDGPTTDGALIDEVTTAGAPPTHASPGAIVLLTSCVTCALLALLHPN